MGQILASNVPLDLNDTGKSLVVDVAAWDRVSVQLSDPGATISTGVVTLQVALCDEVWNAHPDGAVTFTSTTSTHFQVDINVEHTAFIRLIPTTAIAGSVRFTVFGYNVED